MKIIYDENRYLSPEAPPARWIRRLMLAWLTAAAVEFLLLPPGLRDLSGLSGLAAMSPARMALVAAGVFGAVTLASKVLSEAAERWMLFLAGLALMVSALVSSFSWPFLAACVLVTAVLVVYAAAGWNGGGFARGLRRPEKKGYRWAAAAAALVFFLLVSAWTAARVLSFSTPTYDFGIFAQMFHSMRTSGLPITTVERDGALSHFAVHVSPIYYLLLPFYCLVPRPETLQVLQAAVLASAVVPLWKLGKHHGLSQLSRLLLCLVLLVYPAYAGGTSYDIHENAFLTPLILWLFYGIDRKHAGMTAIAAVLTLMVKEDAAVYVAVIGLYLLLRALLTRDRKWGLTAGGLLLTGAMVWFVLVTGYLAEHGDGVMTYRYRNFMYDGSDSLLTVIKAVLLCPMKAVFECVDPEKLTFIALTLLPLGALPLLTRRYERYLLLIPYLLVNLMSDYQYQHDIFFQYTYGSTGCLLYLTVVNLADIRIERRRLAALGGALVVGLSCFTAQIMPKVTKYTGYLVTYDGYYDALRQVLDTVPEDAEVAATTFYTTYLSQRDILYDIRYASKEHVLGCEYIVISLSDTNSFKKYAQGDRSGRECFVELILEQGYEKIAEYEGKLEVYRKK